MEQFVVIVVCIIFIVSLIYLSYMYPMVMISIGVLVTIGIIIAINHEEVFAFLRTQVKRAIIFAKKHQFRRMNSVKENRIDIGINENLEQLTLEELENIQSEKKNIILLNNLINQDLLAKNILKRDPQNFFAETSNLPSKVVNFKVVPIDGKLNFYFALENFGLNQGIVSGSIIQKPSNVSNKEEITISEASIQEIAHQFLSWRQMVIKYHLLIDDIRGIVNIIPNSDEDAFYNGEEIKLLEDFADEMKHAVQNRSINSNAEDVRIAEEYLFDFKSSLKREPKKLVNIKLQKAVKFSRAVANEIIVNIVADFTTKFSMHIYNVAAGYIF